MQEETATGLTIDHLDGLTKAQKLSLARWHERVGGRDEEGQTFFGRTVRSLSIEQRLMLATDVRVRMAWEARERLRVERDVPYFVTGYGSIEPEEGAAIPFDLWPEQADALEVMEAELRVLIGKARQLGLTWLALHFAFWMMQFNPRTPRFRVLCLSKIGSDADELVARTRRLNQRLPAFLRGREKYETRDSNSKFKLAYRGSEMRSLMGTPAAARSFTAGLILLDEFGFYRNGQAQPTWKAALPVLGERGRAIVISTGNGKVGDGAAFAQMWATGKARKIFLPSRVHPARQDPGWRESKREEFLSDEDFEGEYPETEEQMLASPGTFNVYPPEGIAAAERLGEALMEHLDELLEAEGGCEWGIDWGDFQTFTLWGVQLGGGGMFVFDEMMQAHTEPGRASEAIVYHRPAERDVSITFSAADAAPAGTNRTFGRILREAWTGDPYRYPRKHNHVPFGDYKEGGNQKKGVNTVAYIRALLEAAERYDGPPIEAARCLAIGPRCHTLAAQMRNLERDAETGKVRKPALDPRHIERGDHGADALVAMMARRAARWRAEVAS